MYCINRLKEVRVTKVQSGELTLEKGRESRGFGIDCMEGRRSAVQPSFRPTRTTVALRCYFTPRKDVRELLLKKLKNLNLDSVAATEGNRCC